ncbi:MAG: antitoxin family protein [Thermodesulfobacteriota bacterium]
MARTFKARFSKGVIKPLEKVDVDEGKEITVTIVDFPAKATADAFARSAGKWKGTIDAEELIKNIYADRFVSTRPEVKL